MDRNRSAGLNPASGLHLACPSDCPGLLILCKQPERNLHMRVGSPTPRYSHRLVGKPRVVAVYEVLHVLRVSPCGRCAIADPSYVIHKGLREEN